MTEKPESYTTEGSDPEWERVARVLIARHRTTGAASISVMSADRYFDIVANSLDEALGRLPAKFAEMAK